jgi:hypothetical protein
MGAILCSLVGSIGTGAMVRHPEGWRYIFYTLIAVYALVILGFGFLYNPPTPPDLVKRSFGELMHAIDLVGATLAAIGFSLTILGLTWGGGEYNLLRLHQIEICRQVHHQAPTNGPTLTYLHL